jgi:hypothetical protein
MSSEPGPARAASTGAPAAAGSRRAAACRTPAHEAAPASAAARIVRSPHDARRVRPRRGARSVAAGAAIFVAASAGTALAEPPTLRIQRIDSPPAIEQYLDGQHAPPGTLVTGFVQREPGDGVPISEDTRAYVSYGTSPTPGGQRRAAC